jgi:hypothetical protein
MKRATWFLPLLLAAAPVGAAQKISEMDARITLTATDVYECADPGVKSWKCTALQIATFVLTYINSESELEALVADMTNILQASEIDTEAELVALMSDVASILEDADLNSEAELETLLADVTDVITDNDASWAGNAATATALAANGGNCSAGEIALGVDASGAVEGCYEPTEADISDLSHLGEEGVEDFVGGMVTGNTETNIAVTYEDGDGTLDFVVTQFSPNADPSVDHASYVAGHSDGANCNAGEIPLGVDGAGAVEGCYEPTEADISDLAHTATGIQDGLIVEADLNEDSGTPTDGDVLTFDLTGANFLWEAQSNIAAGTAAALAADPDDCAANQFADAIAANGNLTCNTIVDADVPNDITIDLATSATTASNLAADGVNALTEIAQGIKTAANDTDPLAVFTGGNPAGTECVEVTSGGQLQATGSACGAGSGDVADVGDCGGPACFTVASPDAALTFDNATSGTVTLQTVAGALGTVTVSLPAETGTVITDATYVAGHSDGGDCAAGSYPLGVDAAGAVEDCTDASTEIDSIVATHTAVTDAHIDHADDLTELNAQISASIADGAHTADQVGTVTDGSFCQGGGGAVLDCDVLQTAIPGANHIDAFTEM